jgi:hypothetical protein
MLQKTCEEHDMYEVDWPSFARSGYFFQLQYGQVFQLTTNMGIIISFKHMD